MTYTIVARCPRTGRFGIGIATYSIAVGLYCNGVRSRVGVTISQAFVNQGNNTLALRLLEQGFTAAHTLEVLKANDPDAEYRQIADHAHRQRTLALLNRAGPAFAPAKPSPGAPKPWTCASPIATGGPPARLTPMSPIRWNWRGKAMCWR